MRRRPDVIAMAMNNPVTIVPTSNPPTGTDGTQNGLMTATSTTRKPTGSNAGNNHFPQSRLSVTMSHACPVFGSVLPQSEFLVLPAIDGRTSRTTSAGGPLPTAVPC